MSERSGLIDRLLAERRPDRYEPEGGDGWLDSITAEVAAEISIDEARWLLAHHEVKVREGEKTKSANRLLREIGDTKQFPLDWLDSLHLPIAVGKERIALRAASPKDLRDFARDERRRAASDFTARNATCEGAEWLADQIESGSVAA